MNKILATQIRHGHRTCCFPKMINEFPIIIGHRCLLTRSNGLQQELAATEPLTVTRLMGRTMRSMRLACTYIHDTQ
jgi:hypothetical protein